MTPLSLQTQVHQQFYFSVSHDCPPSLRRPFAAFFEHRGDARPPEAGSCSAARVFKTICFGHGMSSQHFSRIRRDAPPSLRCGRH